MLKKIQFADDLTQAQQSKSFQTFENSLKMDLKKLDNIKKLETKQI